jgi:hypothetical protein
MPEDLNYDPEVMELKEEIRGLQGAFAETHCAHDSVKALNKWVCKWGVYKTLYSAAGLPAV